MEDKLIEFSLEHWISNHIMVFCSLCLILSISFESTVVSFYAPSMSVQYLWLWFVGCLHLWFGSIAPQAWVGTCCTWKTVDVAQKVIIPKHVQLGCFPFPCHVLKSINFFSISTEDFLHVIPTVFCISHTNHECVAFGDCMLAICNDILKVPPPWSPLTFNQIWSSGMALLCHVSKSWASNMSSVSVMNLARSETYTHRADFSSFPLTAASQLKLMVFNMRFHLYFHFFFYLRLFTCQGNVASLL